jgi:membrane peptidoglycan carboxypeptidase
MGEVVRQLVARARSGAYPGILWPVPARSMPRITAAQVRRALWLIVAAIAAVVAAYELRSSRLQAALLSAIAQRARYEVLPGPSDTIRFPQHGPLNERYGYTRLPSFVQRLHAAGYTTIAQARWSWTLLVLAGLRVPPPYQPRLQAGLTLFGRHGDPLYRFREPRRVFRAFEDIPPLVVNTLLFIENRELLESAHPYDNPAIEVDRFVKAMIDTGLHHLAGTRGITGGSTLAVQLEKLRHSPEGRTVSIAEKGRQIVSASLRAYLDGPHTLHTRRQLVVEYLNSVPLGAVAGVGEVFGLGDGLAYWFGAELEDVNALLRRADDPAVDRAALAVAYRQTLALLAAVKKPSAFLTRETHMLDRRVDAFLAALAANGIIPAWLSEAARTVRVQPGAALPPPRRSFVDHKAADAVRIELASVLGVDLPDLDRLDADVTTSLDVGVTKAVTEALRRLRSCRHAADAGLVGPRLLPSANCQRVVYSFTLYERSASGNRLRVQTDTDDRPLSLNEGSRLELGSTAKLRTLVTYLELVAALHRQLAAAPPDALRVEARSAPDALTRWAATYLAEASDRRLEPMLEAAMNRRYSASPAEVFFTGGGKHRFSNFDPDDDGRVLTVREAFQRSVNLVFIRLMRDIAEHLGDRRAAAILRDAHHPAREPLLRAFVEGERARAPMGPDAAWLLTTRRKEAQDRAIRIVLEREAFARLHARWRALGYPFDSLVPSYATAIGSSGDNPAALSRLLGIILNDGVELPLVRVETIRFGAHTPYDTTLARRTRGRSVLEPAVAALVRRELVGVVEGGTGRRLKGGVAIDRGVTLPVGGKTGTGDNRFERGAASRVINRTSTFAFTIGDRFFGTIVAYVPGPAAAQYHFTSALPVQLLKHLLPVLRPLLVDAGRHPD